MVDCLYLWFALGFHCCGFVVVGLRYVVWFVCWFGYLVCACVCCGLLRVWLV